MATELHHVTRPVPAGQETTAVSARQGVISGRVILVLLTSLILAVVALTVAYLVFH